MGLNSWEGLQAPHHSGKLLPFFDRYSVMQLLNWTICSLACVLLVCVQPQAVAPLCFSENYAGSCVANDDECSSACMLEGKGSGRCGMLRPTTLCLCDACEKPPTGQLVRDDLVIQTNVTRSWQSRDLFSTRMSHSLRDVRVDGRDSNYSLCLFVLNLSSHLRQHPNLQVETRTFAWLWKIAKIKVGFNLLQ